MLEWGFGRILTLLIVAILGLCALSFTLVPALIEFAEVAFSYVGSVAVLALLWLFARKMFR